MGCDELEKVSKGPYFLACIKCAYRGSFPNSIKDNMAYVSGKKNIEFGCLCVLGVLSYRFNRLEYETPIDGILNSRLFATFACRSQFACIDDRLRKFKSGNLISLVQFW